MKKQISSDFNTRQYMQPVDFELFYYNDTTLKSVAAHVQDVYKRQAKADPCRLLRLLPV